MIRENVQRILSELPAGVKLVVATKSRNISQIQEAVQSGANIIGENYVQEAESKIKVIGREVQWHFIGHLQKNKVKQAVDIFDMIQTVDSTRIAKEINRVSEQRNKIMPILVEVNSGREEQKFGLLPEDTEAFIKQACRLNNIKILGLMTMGPFLEDPEQLRPFFRQTRQLFEHIKSLNLPGVKMRFLSMGMSDSYQIAIQEGANLVRIGTVIFGRRDAE